MENDRRPGLKLGVTGGIGSGKTTICRVFNVLGIPSFSADPVANEIMDNDKEIIERVNDIVGKNLYETGSLNRIVLADLIFNDSKLLEKINSLIHPVVFNRFKEWVLAQTAPYVIMDAAILFESGGSELVDKIATVVAPVDERVKRVIHRNNLTREKIIDRMRNQMDDESRIKLSDYIIYNSENDMIVPAILKIHENILNYLKHNN